MGLCTVPLGLPCNIGKRSSAQPPGGVTGDAMFVAYASPGRKTEALARRLLESGKLLLTLDSTGLGSGNYWFKMGTQSSNSGSNFADPAI